MEVEDSGAIDWHNFERAALALGIDLDTLPQLRVEKAEHFANPPQLPEPTITAPCLSAEEWRVVESALPAKNKYLSKIPPRDFVEACLHLAVTEFAWSILPTKDWSVHAMRAKVLRSFLAGLFNNSVVPAVEATPAFSDHHRKLFRVIAERESSYCRQNESFKKDRQKKLARAHGIPREPV